MIYGCRFGLRGLLKSIAFACFLLLFGLLPSSGHSQQASNSLLRSGSKIQTEQNRDATCKIVYLGIVGGTEPSNNRHSGVVQIRDILRGPEFPNVCAKSFSPYAWRSGFHWILRHFPSHPGQLTRNELEGAPRVILVGHSLGGWGVLSVARNLNRKGIPVELCVQIDSVGITDHTVPKNVKAAAIFHANDAMFLLTTKDNQVGGPEPNEVGRKHFGKKCGTLVRHARRADQRPSSLHSRRSRFVA